MFEYTALVDAPVQRFTGIVTGQDLDAELVSVQVVTPRPPVALPLVEAPVLLIAMEPVSEPQLDLEPAPIALPTPSANASVPARPATRTFVPRPEPSAPPPLVPALIAVAAAGITAMWWLRRDSDDR